MAVCEMHFSANQSLGRMTAATIIFPEGKQGPFPVMYLLHGMSDDHTAWVRRTSVERYVEGLPLIVVMPNGDRGHFVDAKHRAYSAYDTYITRDLAGFVDSTFRTVPGRKGRVIAGLSMGGYGALSVALRHPDMFCAASSHSGAVLACHKPIKPGRLAEFRSLFGPHPQGGPYDLVALIRGMDRGRLPALRIDCGRKDFLLPWNREFHRILNRMKVPHVYSEYPGRHDWEYWDLHIRDTLKFFVRELGL